MGSVKPSPRERQGQERNTLSAQVAEHICREIRHKRLVAGDSLGTEAELAQQFSVSRTVVREAIGHLRGLGVVSSRQGRGLSVANADLIDILAKVFAPVVSDAQAWPELCQLRFVLELGALPWTVARATREQLGRLRHLAQEMRRYVDQQAIGPLIPLSSAFVAQEIEFHQLLVDAAGGKLVGPFHGLLAQYSREAYHQGLPSQPLELPVHSLLEVTRDYLLLVDALEARDVSKALTLLNRRLRPLIDPGAEG